MLDKNSAIAAVNQLDKANFDNISNGLGAMALLPDDVEKLYVQHQTVIGRHLISAEARAAGALFVLCRKHLALGTTSLFRLYSAQMYRESRSAVEGAGIARLIQIDADAYKVFIDDDGSENARKKTRKAFSPAALFPKDVPSMQVLSDFYDTASRLSHTSGLTFLRHISKETPTSEVGFSYQDIARENLPRELPIHLLTLCQTHLAILTAADIIFSDIEVDLEAFRKERADIFGRIMRFHATHKAQWGHKNKV